MTRTSRGAALPAELVGAYGDDLHRLAAVLTGDTGRATELTALTIAEEHRRSQTRSGTVPTPAGSAAGAILDVVSAVRNGAPLPR